MKGSWIRRNLPEIGAFGLLIFMMAFRLMHSPLWGDEWNEYLFSQEPFARGRFYRAVVGTFQPPLYNLLMHVWLSLGKSILWFRLFNLPIGLLSGLLLYASVREAAGRRLALFSVIALAVCHQWVWCIQECSEYALMTLFLFLALRFYIKTLEAFTATRFILFLVGCIGSVWSQYGAVFITMPLLVSLYMRTVFAHGAPLRRRLSVTGAYVFCALVSHSTIFSSGPRWRTMKSPTTPSRPPSPFCQTFPSFQGGFSASFLHSATIPSGGSWNPLSVQLYSSFSS